MAGVRVCACVCVCVRSCNGVVGFVMSFLNVERAMNGWVIWVFHLEFQGRFECNYYYDVFNFIEIIILNMNMIFI